MTDNCQPRDGQLYVAKSSFEYHSSFAGRAYVYPTKIFISTVIPAPRNIPKGSLVMFLSTDRVMTRNPYAPYGEIGYNYKFEFLGPDSKVCVFSLTGNRIDCWKMFFEPPSLEEE